VVKINQLRTYPKNHNGTLDSYNRSIILKYPFRFCILRIVKVTAGNHFSDRLLFAIDIYTINSIALIVSKKFNIKLKPIAFSYKWSG